MVETILASNKNVTKYVNSSKNFAFSAIAGAYSLKTKNSNVVFNFGNVENCFKIIFKIKRISGNGLIFVESNGFVQKYYVSNISDIDISFSKSIKIFRTDECMGEVSILAITKTENKDDMVGKLYNSTCDNFVPNTTNNNNKLYNSRRDKFVPPPTNCIQYNLTYDTVNKISIKNDSDIINKYLPFDTIYNCNEDKYKVSVVISIKNRLKFLKYSLDTFEKQTLPKNEFELIFIDDGSEEDIAKFLEPYSDIFNIKYIRIDSNKSEIPVWSHTPSLSNNVGFKAAEGSVIVICGPEILHSENNLTVAYESAMKGTSSFGIVYHSNLSFVHTLFKHDNIKNTNFNTIFSIPGAKANCITTKGYWWYLLAVKKTNIINIGGVDEEYLRGVCGEDDDFAARLNENGTKNILEYGLIGIHMEHESEDDKYDKRRHRQTPEWLEARRINTLRWEAWKTHKTIVANQGRIWGSPNVITEVKTMRDGIICNYKNYRVKTKYDAKKLKVMYLPLGDQCGMIKGFNDVGVELLTIDILSANKATLAKHLINSAINFKPDLLHMQLQFNNFVAPNTIRSIKQALPNTIISNWSGDVLVPVPDYFIHIGSVVDYNFLSNTGQLEECHRRGAPNTKYWQVGIVEELAYPIAKTRYKYYISFVGSLYSHFPEGKKSRLDFCSALKREFGENCAIFGHGWAKNLGNGLVNPRECSTAVYTESFCVLNISNFNTIADYFSDRFMACMGCGRPIISLYFPNIEKYIKHGFSGLIVKTPEEAVDAVRWLINNQVKAREIGLNSARIALENHTFTHRVVELIKTVGLAHKLI